MTSTQDTQYIIVSRGPAATPGMRHVVRNGEMATFATRKAARAYADSIHPEMPSKYLPLVVTTPDQATS